MKIAVFPSDGIGPEVVVQTIKVLDALDENFEYENVLETSQLWKEIVSEVGKDNPDIMLSHMYIDNAAMQLVKAPKEFDVIVTGNMFGDSLSDQAAMLTDSIDMLPLASLSEKYQNLYEHSYSSVPDIADKGLTNPLATILSAAAMLRCSLQKSEQADWIERAVSEALISNYRTTDINLSGALVSAEQMRDAVVVSLDQGSK